MDCKECETSLDGYIIGDLPRAQALACRRHLDGCAACRETLAEYERLVSAISAAPEPVPSASESAALAAAIAQARLRQDASRRVAPRPRGLPGFVAASAVAFVVVALLPTLVNLGVIDLRLLIGAPCVLAAFLAIVVVVFITSFLPIAITARRRPLNGMTFRR